MSNKTPSDYWANSDSSDIPPSGFIRNIYTDLLPQQQEAFRILLPYMREGPQKIVLGGSYLTGATLMQTLPYSVEVATVVAAVFREFDCTCAYIFPAPGYICDDVLPVNQEIWKIIINNAMSNNGKGMPPYFSIHCEALRSTCYVTLAELLVQDIMEKCPVFNSRYPDANKREGESKDKTKELFTKIGIPIVQDKGDSDE